MVTDQYEQLSAEGDGRVMALALHPFVWLTTSDEIADHYRRTTV
jgi:hypothetical protein